MRLRSFHGKSLSEAMGQVRDVLGEDAIIVATREDKGGLGVRVTAAVEEAEPEGFFIRDEEPEDTNGPDPVNGHAAADEDTLQDHLVQVFIDHGLPPVHMDHLVEAAGGSTHISLRDALAAALARTLDFKPLAREKWPHPIMLVGPPGVGKTSVAAKLAARAVLKGLRPVVLSTDIIRAGGVEQLSALTRVMNVQLMTVEDADALHDAISAVSKAHQIIIDDAGRTPYDPHSLNELKTYLANSTIEPVLVMAAGGDPLESAETAQRFAKIGVKRMAPTRLDSARRLGGLLSAALSNNMALTDFSDTAQIADGLKTPSATLLANRMLEVHQLISPNMSLSFDEERS